MRLHELRLYLKVKKVVEGFIVLDYGEETELVYHCGASSKDAGKKLCAINQITENEIIHPVIDRLLLLPDKQI